MLLDELNIENFGIYKGSDHSIFFTPRGEKNIILIGGLNGGGKTTLLDALQLVLYGKHAKTSNRGRMAYEDYLKETINRHSRHKSAMLELFFYHHNEGKRDRYQVKRSWSVRGKSVRENLLVCKNGVEEPLLSEQWDEYVNEFIPSNISGLFFFDGEKIESLADARKSAGLIKTGIHALLGLDVVDNLSRDLNALKNRRKIKQQTAEVQAQIKQLETRKKELKKELLPLNEQRTLLKDKLSQAESELNVAWLEFRREGGELYKLKKALEEEQNAVEKEFEKHKKEMRKHAEGAAPLLLVKDLIYKAKEQAIKEEEGAVAKAVVESLSVRDSKLLQLLETAGAGQEAIASARQFVEKDKSDRLKQIPEKTYLNVSPEAFAGLNDEFFSGVQSQGEELKQGYDEFQEKIAQISNKLGAVPAQHIIAGIQHRIEESKAEVEKLKIELNLVTKQVQEREEAINHQDAQISKKLTDSADKGFDIERQLKVLEQADNVRDVLTEFRSLLINEDISRLEQKILESFQSLIRKDDLIDKIDIDTDTFKLTLLGKDQQPIKPSRLSAGERQLLAISILWGLAKASGRPLPAIIDTPLGRLDSKHRNHLIENYFPNASHQVILLSTDQEIDQQYCKGLEPYISAKYKIEYQEDIKSSVITPGYF